MNSDFNIKEAFLDLELRDRIIKFINQWIYRYYMIIYFIFK